MVHFLGIGLQGTCAYLALVIMLLHDGGLERNDAVRSGRSSPLQRARPLKESLDLRQRTKTGSLGVFKPCGQAVGHTAAGAVDCLWGRNHVRVVLRPWF